MSLLEIAEMGGGGILLLPILVEVAPIKLNPWSWLAKVAGRALNGEVLDKVSLLERDVRLIKEDAARHEAVVARARILRFGDEILHKTFHTKGHFDQTLRDITAYEQYCDDHPEFENSCAVLTVQKIKDLFMERHIMIDFTPCVPEHRWSMRCYYHHLCGALHQEQDYPGAADPDQ